MNGPEEFHNLKREDSASAEEQLESRLDAEFEAALQRAMRRVEVRSELQTKLFALAKEAEQKRVAAGGGLRVLKLSNGGRVLAMPSLRGWMGGALGGWVGGAIAAVLALGVFLGGHEYQQHERRVEAQRQFETAERITDQTLEHTREQLREAGITLGQ